MPFLVVLRRYPAPSDPSNLVKVVRRRLGVVDAAVKLEALKSLGNMLETLKGDRAGQHAIRIDDQYRVCPRWSAGDADDVEVTDYH